MTRRGRRRRELDADAGPLEPLDRLTVEGVRVISLAHQRPRACQDSKRPIRARGACALFEMELAFAGLHQLCAPMLDRLERLPGPQRDALGAALGLSAGAAPDRFLVGLAVLGLLSEEAEDRLLVCAIEDAQWLDRESAQTLGFVARRLLAERVPTAWR